MAIMIVVLQQQSSPMMGNGHFWGWSWGMMLFWIVVLVVIAALVWRLVGGRRGD